MDPASGTDNGVNQPDGARGASMSPITLPPPPSTQPAATTSAAPAPPAPAVPAPAQTAAPGGSGVANLASSIVDDGDLIEKEWVNRAKHVVATTRSNPYKQSQQLAALRAEYMKKRYGKNIKLGE